MPATKKKFEQPEQPDTITAMARACLEASADNIDTAAAAMADKLLGSPDLLREHLTTVVRQWARAQILSIIGKRRMQIVANQGGQNFRESLDTAMRNEYGRFMDMPLYGGKRLGDATPREVRESAEQYGAISKDARRKARWQEAIAAEAYKQGKAHEPIRNTLNEAALARMWEDANAQ